MFDEPTNHLDFGNQLRTVNKIGELTKKGYAVVMTTHMPDHAMRLGGLTAILNRRGEFLCGSADEVITKEKFGAPIIAGIEKMPHLLIYNAVRAGEEFDRFTSRLLRVKKDLESGSLDRKSVV